MQNEVTLTPVTVIYAVLSCVVYLLTWFFYTLVYDFVTSSDQLFV